MLGAKRYIRISSCPPLKRWRWTFTQIIIIQCSICFSKHLAKIYTPFTQPPVRTDFLISILQMGEKKNQSSNGHTKGESRSTQQNQNLNLRPPGEPEFLTAGLHWGVKGRWMGYGGSEKEGWLQQLGAGWGRGQGRLHSQGILELCLEGRGLGWLDKGAKVSPSIQPAEAAQQNVCEVEQADLMWTFVPAFTIRVTLDKSPNPSKPPFLHALDGSCYEMRDYAPNASSISTVPGK